MKLEFLGTRGYIEPSNDRHRRHSCLLVSYYGRRVLIDAGEDWAGRLEALSPDAIVITHAHPDHCFALKQGAPCTVWASEASWDGMRDFDISENEKRQMPEREPVTVLDAPRSNSGGIVFEAFPVEHSTRAPAVGYRVTAGGVCIFYVPDVVYIEDRAEALHGVDVYIGDGATIDKGHLVRRTKDGALVGHTPFRTQLTWCQKEGVPRAIVTHCGSQIVNGDERTLMATLRDLAEERGGVEVEIAHDGMELVLR